jgi:hypothetical protein
MTVIIECISWLTNVTNINDARWKPEINLLDMACSTAYEPNGHDLQFFL